MKFSLQIFLIILLAGLALLLVRLLTRRNSDRVGRQLEDIIARMEDRYQTYVRDKISLEFLASTDFNIFSDDLVREVMNLLQPELNALTASINSSSEKQVDVQPDSEVFISLGATSAWLNRQRNEQKAPLSGEQQAQLRATMEAGIRADLMRRKMNLESGRL